MTTKLKGYWRSHQVPLSGVKKNPAHFKQLETWMRSYKPEELFDENGALVSEFRNLRQQENDAWARIRMQMAGSEEARFACRTFGIWS